mmetsp:Transcript_194/g.178  ORF Transcript_194/g.178 Transcript_194/m.178 type:complete len:88 (-) Transcript_194:28-291(-)
MSSSPDSRHAFCARAAPSLCSNFTARSKAWLLLSSENNRGCTKYLRVQPLTMSCFNMEEFQTNSATPLQFFITLEHIHTHCAVCITV